MQSIEQTYSIEKVIGQGSFGTILCVRNRHSGKLFACKMEKQTNSKEVLVLKEFEALKSLQPTKRFPVAYEVGRVEGTHYLVMDLLGPSLQQLRIQRGQSRLQIKSIALIAKELLESLQCMHKKGYLHRDLKPDNILLSQDSHMLCLVDFGLSKKCDPPPRRTCSIIGNVRFASRGAHLGFSSCKDDLQSMCYVLLFLYQGWLPWQRLPAEEIKRQLQRKNTLEGPDEPTTLLQMKKSLRLQMFELATDSKIQSLFLRELLDLTIFIQNLSTNEAVDYTQISYLIGRLLFISGASEDNCYEWCPKGCPYEVSSKRLWSVYSQAPTE